MATLNREELKKLKKKRIIITSLFIGIFIIISPLLANSLSFYLYKISGKNDIITDLSYLSALYNLIHIESVRKAALVINALFLIVMLFVNLPMQHIAPENVNKVTDDIIIPCKVGDGQYGNDRFMTEEEKMKNFDVFEYKGKSSLDNIKSGGIIIQNEKIGSHDIYYYVGGTYHSILLGPTRSGKGQRVILKSIWLFLTAGENGLVIDPKGENYHFTREYAEKTKHDVYVLDFRNPNKGMHYNYLSEINKDISRGDIVSATDKTWDFVSVLVGEPKGEKIWNDGECSVIAAIILLITCDAPDEYKNVTNVYAFLAYMSETDEDGISMLDLYMETLDKEHPARLVYQVAKIAPYRTRGSFFTSALATLRLFTNWNVAEMTANSDFDLEEVINKKSIIYLIIPDDKSTLYPLVTLFIKQHYSKMLEVAAKRGNRLPIMHQNIYDEFGNIPKLPEMGSMMSAGAGRGIRNLLVLQDYKQLKVKYGDDAENIKANAEVKILLKTSDEGTKEEFSKVAGKYTVQVASAGISQNDNISKLNLNSSSNISMASRKLLEPSEVGLIDYPYALVYKTGKRIAVTSLPGMKNSIAEKYLGLGDEEFNRQLIEKQEKEREGRVVTAPKLWGVWEKYKIEDEIEKNSERVSFL